LKENEEYNPEKKLLTWIGTAITLFGVLLIALAYIFEPYLINDIIHLIGRDLGIGIFTAGLIILFVDREKASFTGTNEEIKPLVLESINSALKDEFLKTPVIDEDSLKKEIVALSKGPKTIKEIELGHYLDLMDISATPKMANRLAEFYVHEVKRKILNLKDYALVCPKTENTYLASLIASKLEIPTIFVNTTIVVKNQVPDECSECKDKCLCETHLNQAKEMDRVFLFDGDIGPTSSKSFILFDDVMLTGEKLCFCAAIIHQFWKRKISYAIVLVRRKEVDSTDTDLKLRRYVTDVHPIWEWNDDDISKIKEM